MIERLSQGHKDEVKSSKEKKFLTKAEAYQKLSSFCAYQERTQQEVREKLWSLGYDRNDAEELISRLITENFINEERFAKTFAGGKFRIKRWGRKKILNELKLRKLSDYCIKKGMAEIDDEEYLEVLKKLILDKSESLQERNEYKKKHKVALYVINKGFEQDLVWDQIRENL